MACDAMARVAKHGLSLVVFEPPDHPGGPLRDFLVLGAAPDWAEAVRVKVGNKIRRVAVRGNTYALHTEAPITMLRLEGRF